MNPAELPPSEKREEGTGSGSAQWPDDFEKVFGDVKEERESDEARVRELETDVEQATIALKTAGEYREEIEAAHKAELEAEKKMATTDPLTGLWNRRKFEEEFYRSVAMLTKPGGHEERRKNPGYRLLTVILVDVDDFKKINDTRGHVAGDVVLKEVARALVKKVRSGKGDVVARYGGEEFLILVPDISPAEMRRKLSVDWSKGVEVEIDGVIIRVTASAGIAQFRLKDAEETLITLVERADEALYRAKHNGKNRLELAVARPEDESEDGAGSEAEQPAA